MRTTRHTQHGQHSPIRKAGGAMTSGWVLFLLTASQPAPAQEAWQNSWPAFVQRLAEIERTCTVPSPSELDVIGRFGAFLQTTAGEKVFVLDTVNPARSPGTCQAQVNQVFSQNPVSWDAIIDSRNGSTLGLKFQPDPVAALKPVLDAIGQTNATLSNSQDAAGITVGKRLIVRGSLPPPVSGSITQGSCISTG